MFTETRGRPAIFWQTRKAARAANPGARIPRARAIIGGFEIAIDTRERYPYRFAGRDVRTVRAALPAGDYAIVADGDPVASVERKTLENLAASLSDGTLVSRCRDRGSVPRALLARARLGRMARRRDGTSAGALSGCPDGLPAALAEAPEPLPDLGM